MIKTNPFSNQTFTTVLVGILSFLILSATPNPFPLTSDECFSLYHAQFPIPTIWKELSRGNNPPLFETLLHFWIKAVGYSESSVRILPTVLISMATAGIWRLALSLYRSLFSAAAACLFFLGSNTVLLFAHEVRAYGLLLCLSVACQALWVLARGEKSNSLKMMWSLSAIALAYTHFFGLWILLIQAIYDLKSYLKNKNKIAFLHQFSPWFLVIFAYLPYLRVLMVRFIDSASSGTWMEPAPWSAPYFTLWKFTNIPMAVFPTIILFILAIKTSVKSSKIPSNIAPRHYLIVSFAVPFLIMWLISLPSPVCIPMFNERYSSFVIPSLTLIIAGQIDFRNFSKESLVPFKIPIALWIFLLVGLYSFRAVVVNQNIDVRSIVQETQKNNTIPIVLEPDHSAFQWLYYTHPDKFKQWRSDSIYHHMAQQLIKENVFILRTRNSLDSLGLSDFDSLYYVHMDNRKTLHTLTIETIIRDRFLVSSFPFTSARQSLPVFKSKTTEFWKLKRK